MSHPFAAATLAPRDPIAGITELFVADSRPDKVNLGVGVYTDESGGIPQLVSVRAAQDALHAAHAPSAYLPIDGLAGYTDAVQRLLFGDTAAPVIEGRAVTLQSPGGTGALRIGADLLHRLQPEATVLVSSPTWDNHRAVFEAAGLRVAHYPYYDASLHGVNIECMLAALDAAPAGTVVVLHACCHNPTGADLSLVQWQAVAQTLVRRRLVPFLDMAYQGFADGLNADAAPARLLAAAGLPLLVANSFSKNLSLYGERVGALTVVSVDRDMAARLRSQLKQIARVSYSNPPSHGARLAQAVLTDPLLKSQWRTELDSMRSRIVQMRAALVRALRDAGIATDIGFISEQRGMFSYLGTTPDQVRRLREEHAVYLLDTGRICLAALNLGNLDRVSASLMSVLRQQASSARWP